MHYVLKLSWRASEVDEPWAILCRHPLDTVVPEHSVNPCLVVGARNAVLGGELAAQGAERRILLRTTEADVC
jgi:hypothetical protein